VRRFTRRFMILVSCRHHRGFGPRAVAEQGEDQLFGRGYEERRKDVGLFAQGRVWSSENTDDIALWVKWCHRVGAKLIDDTSDTGRRFSRTF